MQILALLSNRDDVMVPHIKGALGKYTVYPLKTMEEVKDLYSNIPLNLLLIDTISHSLSSLRDFLSNLDDDITILIAPEKIDKFTKDALPKSVFDCVDIDSIRTELPDIVERALEKQKFKKEIRLLKQARSEIAPVQPQSVAYKTDAEMYSREVFSNRYEPVPSLSGRYVHERVVVNFAKMLTVSFDMRKLFDHFIDSVMEIARVSKVSVMIKDKDGFKVKTNYGLDPYFADNLVLSGDSPLVNWLSRTGRIMHKPVSYADDASIDIKNEMELLQCSVSFPMIYKGKLIGILNIDNKITEEPFYREELEIIYVLCNYLAAAIKDIDVYHQIWYQKEFTNNILASMSSGMIAIDTNEKVSIFNQKAAEILQLVPSDIIGNDLRVLPSPLGDLLFETMETGNSHKRHEVTVQPMGLPLGINSYRLVDEQQNPLGAGIVFNDLSDSKKLEEQRSRVEKLEAVNDLMSKIAHEVRNPLTSIQTYTQLLHEKYTDDDMQKFFVTTVKESINRLNVLIDKLVVFSTSQDYNFRKENINDILSEASDYISKQIPQTHKISVHLTDKIYYINADKKQLIKAVYYLILNIIDRTPDGTSVTLNTNVMDEANSLIEILLTYEADGSLQDEMNTLLKPLLDIDHLGTELNIPISNKIVEGHEGTLTVRNTDGMNAFVIQMPIFERRTPNISIDEGRLSGH
jgi:nitrogen-specific signal transduction histidine kinase